MIKFTVRSSRFFPSLTSTYSLALPGLYFYCVIESTIYPPTKLVLVIYPMMSLQILFRSPKTLTYSFGRSMGSSWSTINASSFSVTRSSSWIVSNDVFEADLWPGVFNFLRLYRIAFLSLVTLCLLTLSTSCLTISPVSQSFVSTIIYLGFLFRTKLWN